MAAGIGKLLPPARPWWREAWQTVNLRHVRRPATQLAKLSWSTSRAARGPPLAGCGPAGRRWRGEEWAGQGPRKARRRITYRVAVARWPAARITGRQGNPLCEQRRSLNGRACRAERADWSGGSGARISRASRLATAREAPYPPRCITEPTALKSWKSGLRSARCQRR